MRIDSGTAWGSGQISNTSDPVIVMEFHARSDNTASAAVGVSDVSATNGRELIPGESVTWNFSQLGPNGGPGSVLFSQFYVSVSGGDGVDWTVVIR